MNFSSFFSYTFLTAYTPGPNNIMSMTNAGRDGFKRSIPFFAGIFTGFVIVMSACAAFCTLLYKYIPSFKPAMIYIGAAYLLYLAFTVWRDKPHKKNSITHANYFLSGMALLLVYCAILLFL